MIHSVYLWEGQTIQGNLKFGVARDKMRRLVRSKLQSKGYYNLKISSVPTRILSRRLTNRNLLDILNTLVLVLGSGASLQESLSILIRNNPSLIARYVFTKLDNILHQGESLEQAFKRLSPMFPEFFVATIALSEKTGKLIDGLNSLVDFYTGQESRKQAIAKVIRYPKIVCYLTLGMSLAIVVFIIPMFSNVYALFRGDLPVLTQWLVYLSELIRHSWGIVGGAMAVFIGWYYCPGMNRLHPVFGLARFIASYLASKEDQLLYAHAMKILLAAGQSVRDATMIAGNCLSAQNKKHGVAVSELLSTGVPFSQAFFQVPWFPSIYRIYIESAEKAGSLQTGFHQVSYYIQQTRAARFEKLSKLIEPILILLVGTIILVLLLAVYLPIFDLGNQFN